MTLHVVYTPDHAAQVPANDDPVVVVNFARFGEEMADAAATLREMGRTFTSTWIDHGARPGIPPAAVAQAERDLAKALAASLTRGEARKVRVYADEVTDLRVAAG